MARNKKSAYRMGGNREYAIRRLRIGNPPIGWIWMQVVKREQNFLEKINLSHIVAIFLTIVGKFPYDMFITTHTNILSILIG